MERICGSDSLFIDLTVIYDMDYGHKSYFDVLHRKRWLIYTVELKNFVVQPYKT